MSAKIDVVLLQAVKWLWQKNDVVSVSVAYAKNVLYPKWQAKQADALAKNNIAQKQAQEKKHIAQIWELRDSLHLYAQAEEPLIIKRKVTPSGGLYEKVHETDVKAALTQWKTSLPADITITKQTRDEPGSYKATFIRGSKKLQVPFTIKESQF